MTSSTVNFSNEPTKAVLDALDNNSSLPSKTITAGFDGFIDTIVRVIREKGSQNEPTFFNTKHEFAEYILEKEGASFSLEVEQLHMKLGGNMPIMANALARLGANVNCIGALGHPHPHAIFDNFPGNCRLYSFAEPGTSTAVEFDDGKILLGNMGVLNTFGWREMKERIGIETLINLYKQSDLLCILNWSEIDASTDIWKGLLSDVLPAYEPAAIKQPAFFDISDCSKRSTSEIMEMTRLLKEFTRYTRVILGVNRNEARLIYQALYPGMNFDDDLTEPGSKIFEKLGIDTLVLHSSQEAICINESGIHRVKCFSIPRPRISTGAGDNFNAGFIAGLLMELSAQPALLLANAVAAIYMQTGISASLSDVKQFLQT